LLQLIRAEAHAGGLPQSEIDTQVPVNIPDGGVDTRVRAAVPRDNSGFLVLRVFLFQARGAQFLFQAVAAAGLAVSGAGNQCHDQESLCGLCTCDQNGGDAAAMARPPTKQKRHAYRVLNSFDIAR
jgi:hypothetical protein